MTDWVIVQEREALLSMLSSIHYVDKHLRARKSRHPGSGTWATNTTVFAEWLASEQSTCLWCYGIRKRHSTFQASNLKHITDCENRTSSWLWQNRFSVGVGIPHVGKIPLNSTYGIAPIS